MIIISSKEFNQRASAILKLSQTEPTFEQLFGQNAPEISDDFADEFDRELTRIRQNSHLRVADFNAQCERFPKY